MQAFFQRYVYCLITIPVCLWSCLDMLSTACRLSSFDWTTLARNSHGTSLIWGDVISQHRNNNVNTTGHHLPSNYGRLFQSCIIKHVSRSHIHYVWVALAYGSAIRTPSKNVNRLLTSHDYLILCALNEEKNMSYELEAELVYIQHDNSIFTKVFYAEKFSKCFLRFWKDLDGNF